MSLSNKDQLNLLREAIKSLKKVCVAYSGGIDSSLVAAIAYEQLKDKAIAVTGVSAALSDQLLIEARDQALWIGIKHQECTTREIADPSYNQNPRNRCFACKKELHKHMSTIAKEAKNFQIIDGVNHDDMSDYRPGIKAAREAGVRSPLAELKIDKLTVRAISRLIGLPWWNKPAQPCLASRFPYGESITTEELKRVDKAETWMRMHGFNEIRVRSQTKAAKIELPQHQIQDLFSKVEHSELVDYFLSIGFTSVSVDLEGLISGKLNRDLEKID